MLTTRRPPQPRERPTQPGSPMASGVNRPAPRRPCQAASARSKHAWILQNDFSLSSAPPLPLRLVTEATTPASPAQGSSPSTLAQARASPVTLLLCSARRWVLTVSVTCSRLVVCSREQAPVRLEQRLAWGRRPRLWAEREEGPQTPVKTTTPGSWACSPTCAAHTASHGGAAETALSAAKSWTCYLQERT